MRSPIYCFYLLVAFCLFEISLHAQPAPSSPHEFAEFVEPDFPFITTTLNAGTVGGVFPERNVAVRCLVLMLGNDSYACFDTDLLRVAATWQGEFISLRTMAQVSYHKAGAKGNGIPEILGEPLTATGMYPGWLMPGQTFEDPRPSGPNPNEYGRGPVDESLGHWHGVHIVNEQAVLIYSIGSTGVEERISSLPDQSGVVRSLRIDQEEDNLKLILAEYNGADHIQVIDQTAVVHVGKETIRFMLDGELEGVQLAIEEDRYLVVNIEKTHERMLGVAIWKSSPNEESEGPNELNLDVPQLADERETRWPEQVTTSLIPGTETYQGYTIDQLELPIPNPWGRNVRISGIDFFTSGMAAVSTFEGDIWLVRGLTDSTRTLTWKRYASGLYEPMSLSIVDDKIYTFGREGIITYNDLNGDGEADYYENFSNSPIQTIESREYPSSMHPRPEGGFYLAKGAATNNGPKTNPRIMNGFRAGGLHSGTVLRVSADGRTVERFATGFRQPYIGVHPEKGWVTASDQQGNFVPSSPIYFVQEGDYYGVPATAHQDIPPEIAEPLAWVPHNVDRSGTEQVWMTSGQFGPLNDALIHLSYGKPGVFLVYHKEEDGKLTHGAFTDIPIPFSGPLMEGAVHPIDGQLYMGGFQVWDSNAEDVSSLYRMRYIGGEDFTTPIGFKKGKQGVILEYAMVLDREAAEDVANYSAKRWNYKRTGMYGSPIFRLNGIPGKENVRITNAELSNDGKTLFVQLQDPQNVMQMELAYTLKTASGESIEKSVYFSWNEEAELDLVAEGFGEDAFIVVDIEPEVEEETVNKVASVDRGQELYQQIGCIGCHSIDGSTEGRTGPTFLGIMGKLREFNDGTSLVADEEYIRESIYEPSAKEVKGLDVEMPSYLGLLDEADVASIILFIESLDESN